jgi:hypothetical protein
MAGVAAPLPCRGSRPRPDLAREIATRTDLTSNESLEIGLNLIDFTDCSGPHLPSYLR